MDYRVSLTESAKEDIAHFEASYQRIIVAGIMSHLRVDAEVSTRRRKQLRRNPVAPWELRIERFRIFCSAEGTQVKVVAADHKEHNGFFIRGKRLDL